MADIYNLNDLIDNLDKPALKGLLELIDEELDNNAIKIKSLESRALRGSLEEFTNRKFEITELDGIAKGLRRVIHLLEVETLIDKVNKEREKQNKEGKEND